MCPTQSQSAPNPIVDATRSQVAEEGLRGLSMRKVAARAGSSRGGVASQAGQKADLLASLVADMLCFQQAKHARWLQLTASLDVADEGVLAAIVTAFLDEAVTCDRSQSLVLCELVTESARKKQRYADLAELVAAEEKFWCDLQRNSPNAEILGWAIANYLRDELPFALALHGQAEYHLLRSSTIARLAQRIAPIPEVSGFAAGFDRFADLDISILREKEEGRSHEIGQAIARLIHREGVTGISHRSVAAEAGIPKSSVAHHYRTREELLKAGLRTIYRQLTDVDLLYAQKGDGPPNMLLSIASHAIALEATRNADLTPFALDVRRMRGEVIWNELSVLLGPGRSDLPALQAPGMIMVGCGLGLHLAAGEVSQSLDRLHELFHAAAENAR